MKPHPKLISNEVASVMFSFNSLSSTFAQGYYAILTNEGPNLPRLRDERRDDLFAFIQA